MTNLEKEMIGLAKSQVEFSNFQSHFMNETRANLKIQSEQIKNLDVQIGQVAKILSKEQESLPKFEEPIRE